MSVVIKKPVPKVQAPKAVVAPVPVVEEKKKVTKPVPAVEAPKVVAPPVVEVPVVKKSHHKKKVEPVAEVPKVEAPKVVEPPKVEALKAKKVIAPKKVEKPVEKAPEPVEVEEPFQFDDEVTTDSGTYTKSPFDADFNKTFAKESCAVNYQYPYRIIALEEVAEGEKGLTEFIVVFVTPKFYHVIDVSSVGENAESHNIYKKESVEKGIADDGSLLQLYKFMPKVEEKKEEAVKPTVKKRLK